MKYFEMDINKSDGPLLRPLSSCILKTALKERLMESISPTPLKSQAAAAKHKVEEFESKTTELNNRLQRGFQLILANFE